MSGAEIEKLYLASKDFRNAIDTCYRELGVAFSSFPRGSCGEAAPMLGTYLIEQGLGEFQYMLGDYGSIEGGNWSSHAWLQSGNLIVDITADQFPDIDKKVIVQEDHEWHKNLK
ncbi:MAG: hypothetical protein GY751_22005 [Bacteroidetes bacterium]|nr:hypothetical protein [Bacteroidota bacterium]